jgi:anti-sigma factor RsiW
MSQLELSVPEIEELLGAYALDAVDADERAAVDAHLLTCPRCRAELAGHLEVASWMAGGGSPAPDGVWDRIADSLDDHVPALRLTSDDLDAARRARGPASPPPTVVDTGAPAGGNVVSLAGRSRRPMTQVLLAAVGVAAAVILVLGIVVARQENRLDQMSREVATVDIVRAAGQAMADPGATRVALSPPVEGGPEATVVVLPDGTGFVQGVNLPPLPDGRTYQLWGVQDERVISLGVLGSAPTVSAVSTGGVAFTTYVLTEEDPGGVPQSSNPPVALGTV